MLPSELKLLFGRMRTRGLLLALAAIPTLLAVAVWASGGPGGGRGPEFLDQVSHNGVFAALAGLTVVIPFFLPLAIAVVAGDTIAGEAGLGTLRYLLTRPVGRTRLLLSKFAAAVTFCAVAALVVLGAGLVAGAVLFPVGRVTTLSGTTVSLGAGMARALAAAVVVGASMVGLAAVGVFLSTLTDSAVGAIAGTAAVAIVSQVLDAVPQLHAIHPVLLTHAWQSFGDLMRTPITLSGVAQNLAIQAGWAAVFLCAAWARLTSKDILA